MHFKHCLKQSRDPQFKLKGVTGNVWWLNWDWSIIETFFRIHLRPIRRLYGAYLFSKSANAIFKILIDRPLWRDSLVLVLLYKDNCGRRKSRFFVQNSSAKVWYLSIYTIWCFCHSHGFFKNFQISDWTVVYNS